MTQIMTALTDISDRYDALFCRSLGLCAQRHPPHFPRRLRRCSAFREKGGIVVLVTNAPRPRHGVEEQITAMGVPHDCWDTIATSGDSARLAMFRGVVGDKVCFIGEDRDRLFRTAPPDRKARKFKGCRLPKPKASSAPVRSMPRQTPM